MMPEVERVWRARKNHTWIDAQLRPSDEATFELRFFYDGDLVFSRSWPTRDAALAHASRQLGELQRAGWNTHW
jgi:hypothetical protein